MLAQPTTRSRLTRRRWRGTLYEIESIPTDRHGVGSLMHAKLTGTHSTWRRRLAIAAGAILLLAQSVSAAHYHPSAFAQRPSIAASASSDSLCSLCLHQQHATTVSAAQFPLAAPTNTGHLDPKDFSFALVSSFDSHLFGRAPPASV